MTIHFYSTQGDYGFFSNFSSHPIAVNGKVWPTTEHYFQAQKFAGTPHEEQIRRAKSPGDAARMGRDRSRPLRADWESIKDNVMRVALRAKFTQHEDLRVALLATGHEHLVEATTSDYYWGCGTDGTGKNMLGILLVELRDALRSESQQSLARTGDVVVGLASGERDIHVDVGCAVEASACVDGRFVRRASIHAFDVLRFPRRAV
ncbi:MAG: NADAR family protein [Polyangiaceae bacterium]